jgi:hypothetical protein
VHVPGDGAREASQPRQQLDDLAAHLLLLTHIYDWARAFLPTVNCLPDVIPCGAEDCIGAYRIVYGGSIDRL